jgi:guanylate kinase
MTREEFMATLPALVKNYQPADSVLKRINNVELLMMIGPSGVGKTTLINKIGLAHVLTDTTRAPRPGEKDAVDFYFRNEYAEVIEDIKSASFVQIALGAEGDMYATRATSYPDQGQAVMAVMADVIPVFRKLGFSRTISAFITPPSFEEWQSRLRSHNLSEGQLNKRLAEGKRSLMFALADTDTHMVLNDDVEDAVKHIKDLISGQVDQKMEQKAKAVVEKLLSKLELISA